MLIYLLFFISSLGAGLAIFEIFRIYPSAPLRLAGAFTLGTTANLLFLFLIANVFGLNFASAFISIVAILATSAFFAKFGEILEGMARPSWKHLQILIPLFPIAIIIFVLFYNSIFISADSIIAGNRLVWVDWPIHISLVSSFFRGDNFPPQNPMHPIGVTTYPFFIEFLSAILLSLGASLKNSLVVPGIIYGLISSVLLYIFGRTFFEKRSIAIVALYVGLISGGLGFIYFFNDLAKSPNLLQTLLFPPQEYTFLNDKNIWFFTFLYSELLPQRAFLLGLPIFLTSVMLLIFGITNKNKSETTIAAYLIGTLPFIHMHSYISAMIFSFFYILLHAFDLLRTYDSKKVRDFLFLISVCFALPILGLGLIQLPIFLNVATEALSPHLGWQMHQENFFLFWLKNTGLFWPLFIAGIFMIKNKVAKNIILASLPLFILPNLFRFAPWPYDNLKILTYWYLIGAFAVATALVGLWSKNYIGKIIATILFIALTFSGFLEITRIANAQKTKIPLWNKNDIELAEVIIEQTPPQSTILAAAVHDHPITSLAGRKIPIGYPGNAWSWGFSDWQQREDDARIIFQGNPTTSEALINKYKIDYILISLRERNFEPQINEEFFRSNYEIVAAGPDYKLYEVK